MSRDARLAGVLAEEAGRLLVGVRAEAVAEGVRGKALSDRGDAAAQRFLANALAEARPGDAVLSEEARDSELKQARVAALANEPRRGADATWPVSPGSFRVGGTGRFP